VTRAIGVSDNGNICRAIGRRSPLLGRRGYNLLSMSNETTPKPFRIKHLSIQNYKGIDTLEINFSLPELTSTPDIVVMGSKNGIGKTSVLECISLSVVALLFGHQLNNIVLGPIQDEFHIDFFKSLIRSGENSCCIISTFTDLDQDYSIQITITNNDTIKVSDISSSNGIESLVKKLRHYGFDFDEDIIFYNIFGIISEPTISPFFSYFHSYRKIQEGNPEMGMIFDEQPYRRSYRRGQSVLSAFKREILRSMMSRGGLFEDLQGEEDSGEILDRLNDLMSAYAKGKIEKLKPSSDNTLEFRVKPDNGSPSFSFDGLSSGQKEIISTLFLIWKNSRNQPGIVLIDEPELHLNAEWHSQFIHDLAKINPKNQYIIATHSEQIFESVDKEQRIMLSR
jgi:predicted ATP-dependent endonuclease of OLD family